MAEKKKAKTVARKVDEDWEALKKAFREAGKEEEKSDERSEGEDH